MPEMNVMIPSGSSVLHVVAGRDDWCPTEEDMQALYDLFTGAACDPNGGVVVTRSGVRVESVGSAPSRGSIVHVEVSGAASEDELRRIADSLHGKLFGGREPKSKRPTTMYIIVDDQGNAFAVDAPDPLSPWNMTPLTEAKAVGLYGEDKVDAVIRNLQAQKTLAGRTFTKIPVRPFEGVVKFMSGRAESVPSRAGD